MQSLRKNQKGTAQILQILVIILAIGVFAFLLLSSTAPFKNFLNVSLYPKPPSHAATVKQLFGVNDHFLRYDDATTQQHLDWVKYGGLPLARVDVNWLNLEPTTKGQYDLSYLAKLDQIIAEMDTRGIRPLIVFLSAPEWTHPGSTNQMTPPDNINDFADVMGFLAAHYKNHGNMIYEVWNEPNCSEFWAAKSGQPIPDPVKYTAMLKASYTNIKISDPGATVLGGVMCFSDAGFLQSMYDAGAKGYFDGISFHPYAGKNPPDYQGTPDQSTWNFQMGVESVEQTVLKNGDNKPLWLTEWGWTLGTCTDLCVDEATRAEYYTKAVQLIKGWSFVAGATQYALQADDGGGANIFINNNPTSTWNAYIAAVNSLASSTPTPSPISGNQIQNSTFDTGNPDGSVPLPWLFQAKGSAKGALWRDTTSTSINGPSGRVDINQIDPTSDWYVQLNQANLSLIANQETNINFWARAGSDRTINVAVQQAHDPWTVFYTQPVALTTKWQKYSFKFTPTTSDANVWLAFELGLQTGQVWFDNVYYCNLNCSLTSILGDIDGNGVVDIYDYNILVTNFDKTGTNIPGDLDNNGKVDIFDYNILVTNFGKQM